MYEETPRYVKYNGDYVDVSEFAHLSPKERPIVTCPQCDEPVTLKLGKVMEHHFAHSFDSNCHWSPESILHLHTKLEIAEALKVANTVRPVASCQRCKKHKIPAQSWIGNWNRVEVECRVGQYIADIALLQDSTIMGVIEVWVNHKTVDEKIDYLTMSNIQWIEFAPTYINKHWEIDGINVIVDSVRSGHFEFGHPTCPDCINLQKIADEQARLAAQARIEERMQRRAYTIPTDTQRFIGIMVIDVYYEKLARRHEFLVKELRTSNGIISVIVDEGDVIANIHGSVDYAKARKLVDSYIETQYRSHLDNGGKVSVHPQFYRNDAWRTSPYIFVLSNGNWVKNIEYWNYWAKNK